MKIIEVRPCKRFRRHWSAVEAPGVEPSYPELEHAISYATSRFGGGFGEIHVYDDAGENVVATIPIDDGGAIRPTAGVRCWV